MKKKIILGIIIILVLIMDWAALDDITTGNETNVYGEYAILISSLLVYILLGRFSIDE